MRKRSLIITGSLAYDHIMTFPDKFENHILPEKVHMLNVAFNVENLEKTYGGTAGNIAYSLSLLGEKPVIHATAGNDFEDYKLRMKSLGLSFESVKIIDDEKTAQAFVTTDLADNQITAFHGGAMYRADEHPLVIGRKAIVIIAPNGIKAMTDYAKYCRSHSISFIFDPGQAFNALSADQLVKSVHSSLALTLNDYEWEMWKSKTSLTKAQTLELTENIIITLGKKGSRIVSRDTECRLPAIKDIQTVDPTGCGDAFRAGLLFGLSRGWDIKKSAEYGTVLASFCVEKQGTQNHSFEMKEFEERLTYHP